MALQKAFSLREGIQANYLRFDRIEEFSRTERKAVVIFSLFVSKEVAANPQAVAIKPEWCRLRLEREKFDKYFSNEALSKAFMIEQAYAAAKAEYVDTYNGSGLLLADAVDV